RDPLVTGVQTCALPIFPFVPRRRPGQLQRGPLVFGHHRRGVDGGGCVVPRRGGRLLIGRRGRGGMTVGQRPHRGQVAILVRVGRSEERRVGKEWEGRGV